MAREEAGEFARFSLFSRSPFLSLSRSLFHTGARPLSFNSSCCILADALLERAVQWNHLNSFLAACRGMFDGFKHCVEVCVFEFFDAQDDADRYEQILFDLLCTLLQVRH